MLLQIWADEDRDPPWTGELELRDAETGAALKLDFDEDARERYTRRIRRVLPIHSKRWRCAAAAATRPSRPRNRSKT